MRLSTCLLPLSALLFASLVHADDNADLRAENARLRTQLEALQKSCPVASTTVAPASSPAMPAVATVAAPVAATATAESAAPSIAPPADVATAAPVAPAGYKLVPIAPPRPEDRYIDAGCKKVPHNTPWLQSTNWSLLRRDMTPADVEDLLGPQHYNVVANGRVGWQYGKCEFGVRGTVVFENDRVVVWQKPTL